MEHFKACPALDTALIPSAKAVECYEGARCGTPIACAKQIGLTDAGPPRGTNLQEEEATERPDRLCKASPTKGEGILIAKIVTPTGWPFLAALASTCPPLYQPEWA